MAENTGGLRRPLADPRVYSLVQRLLGADAVRRRFLDDHVRPVADERLLDLGCGPGDVLELLPNLRYVGVDFSPEYVAAARARFGGRGSFVCSDVRELSLDPAERFDAVISIGVIHHLDDDGVKAMTRFAARVLTPEGRLITIDPGFAEGQRDVARWLIERDRGLHVRTPDGYRHLVRSHFSSVEVSVHHDLARVPYSHVVLECRMPHSA